MWLQFALNGSRSKADHPAVPITPEEQAAAARESVVAGTSAIHTHVRGPDGRESLASNVVAAVLDAIRRVCPRTPVGISTGIWIVSDPAARLDAVRDWDLRGRLGEPALT